jgi:hypothetical protein
VLFISSNTLIDRGKKKEIKEKKKKNKAEKKKTMRQRKKKQRSEKNRNRLEFMAHNAQGLHTKVNLTLKLN